MLFVWACCRLACAPIGMQLLCAITTACCLVQQLAVQFSAVVHDDCFGAHISGCCWTSISNGSVFMPFTLLALPEPASALQVCAFCISSLVMCRCSAVRQSLHLFSFSMLDVCWSIEMRCGILEHNFTLCMFFSVISVILSQVAVLFCWGCDPSGAHDVMHIRPFQHAVC